jgi:predicted small lipoprotein YifL
MARQTSGKRTIVLLISALMVITLLAACGGKASTPPPATAPAPQAAAASKPWQADGIISEGEYTLAQKIGDIEVFSRLDGDTVMLALKAQTSGWMALGIDPEDKMKGADILLCFVKDGQAKVVDMYSTGPFGPHPPDEQQGSTNDIAVVGGSLKDGIMVVEFKRKLSTGDSKDKQLRIGENKVIWAIGDTADPTAKHSRRGYGTLALK